MPVAWLTPIAFAGLALIAAPILIHLLTRHERRPIPFPSLRFLRSTRLSALSRRRIDDWPLLLLRLAIVAAAVAALAGPLFVTAARERAWASRISRAVIVTGDAHGHDQNPAAVATATFEPGERMSDAIDAALVWLGAQPPSAREILIVGDLRAAMLTEADIARIPAGVGLRFAPLAEGDVRRDVAVPILGNGDGRPISADVTIRQEDDSTIARPPAPRESSVAPRDIVRVLAAPVDQPVADAALRAVLSGLVVRDQAASRRVTIVFSGADSTALGPVVAPPTLDWVPGAVERLSRPGQQYGDTLVVPLETRPVDARAAAEIAAVAAAVFADPRGSLDPRRLTAAELAGWSRPPGAPDASQPRQDEGDRRWLWGLTLALLLIEHWVRRRGGSAETSAESAREANVA